MADSLTSTLRLGKRVAKPSLRMRGMRPTSEYPRNLPRHPSLLKEEASPEPRSFRSRQCSQVSDAPVESITRIGMTPVKQESSDTEGLGYPLYSSSNAESDIDFPWPLGQDRGLQSMMPDISATQAPTSNDAFPTSEVRLALMIAEEASMLVHGPDSQTPDPEFSILDTYRGLHLVAFSDDARSRSNFLDQVHVAIHRPNPREKLVNLGNTMLRHASLWVRTQSRYFRLVEVRPSLVSSLALGITIALVGALWIWFPPSECYIPEAPRSYGLTESKSRSAMPSRLT
ncbi:hypothetical protein NMY22_g7132 [Coprinellus aureogranulatus]|nr:hypothetical protein NMY22_g7132 [Coprinellus aureogranulatus]